MISVIIPVYNTAQELPRCLDSILNNTYRDLEIICINDGSKDHSLDILNTYAANDSRIRVIDQKNAGVSAARNRGLDAAVGEYIAFVDSDDWVHHRYFEILLQSMDESGADIQICGDIVTSEQIPDPDLGEHLSETTALSERQALENSLNVWKRLYKREVIRDIRFLREMRFAEDRVFNMEIYRAIEGIRVMQITSPMYYYYMREGSAVHSLHPREVKPLVLWYRDHMDDTSGNDIYQYYLIDAAKKILSWRYSILYLAEDGERELVSELVHLFHFRIKHCDCIGIINKLVYVLFLMCPNAYRLFRIVSDPTMLGWEKLQRKKAREEKRKK